MNTQDLRITTIQSQIFWGNKEQNLNQFTLQIESNQPKTDIIVLPEMFNTGYSLNFTYLSEHMNGPTCKWMQEMANKANAVILGTLMIKDGDKIYNRMVWAPPHGEIIFYDKVHLFSLAKEERVISAGTSKRIIEYKKWKILLSTCYDLRFPVWLRNTEANSYDVLIVSAAWPEKRSAHWRTLLEARAIENLAYVVGVNCLGEDENKIKYDGSTSIFDPMGQKLHQKINQEDIYTQSFSYEYLLQTRRKFPFLNDIDQFELLNYK